MISVYVRMLLVLVFILGFAACSEEGDPPPRWETAFEADSLGWLLNVGGSAPDDLYVVGGSPDEGVMMHNDGSTWTPVALPAGTPLLNWVHAFAADDIFVAGNEGTILHFDGTAWAAQSSGVDRNLWGIWGARPDDVWAVGGNGMEDGQATVVRFDGSTWSTVDVPMLERPRVWAWFKVFGFATDDVWIVGQRGAVIHWDGTQITEHLVGVTEDLISLWGTGPDNLVVVGGRGNGVAAAWNGASWRSQSLAPLLGLNGIWMRNDGVAHVVGPRGTTAVLDVDTFGYEETLTESTLDLHAVFAVGESPLVAVGGSLASPSAPYRGLAVQRELSSDE